MGGREGHRSVTQGGRRRQSRSASPSPFSASSTAAGRFHFTFQKPRTARVTFGGALGLPASRRKVPSELRPLLPVMSPDFPLVHHLFSCTCGPGFSNWRSLGWRIEVRCAWGRRDAMKTIRECKASVQIDLETLVWTRGRAFPLDTLSSRMKCIRCGSRRVTVFFHPPPATTARRAAG
jgi:hypothetical protein